MKESFIDRIGGMNVLLIGGAVVVSIVFLLVVVLSQGGRLTQLESQVVDIAVELGLDKDKFAADFKSDEANKAVDADIEEYKRISNGESERTPSIFVNGKRNDSLDYESLKSAVQKSLDDAKKDKSIKLPLEIVIFEDLQCPACAAFFPVPFQIKNDFKDKIKLVHRHLPLESIHTRARLYARGLEAAKKQNKAYEFTRAVFTKENPNDYSVLDKLPKSAFE